MALRGALLKFVAFPELVWRMAGVMTKDQNDFRFNLCETASAAISIV
jgi:hypothetical protein